MSPLSDWPDVKIDEYRSRLSAIVPDVKWRWDFPRIEWIALPRFIASTADIQLIIYVDGSWQITRSGYAIDDGRGTTFEGGARGLLVAFRKAAP